VTERLGHEIERAKLTGVELDDVEVTASEQFRDFYPDRQLPKFVWLKVVGKPHEDDFGMGPGLFLVTSERTLELLRRFGIQNAEVDEAV
jgi:hypothetical protein